MCLCASGGVCFGRLAWAVLLVGVGVVGSWHGACVGMLAMSVVAGSACGSRVCSVCEVL